MTGMRRGEILGLRWEDVDLDSNRLAVRRHSSTSITGSLSPARREALLARSISTGVLLAT